MNGFDRLAPFYDKLTRFVFGKSMIEAQTVFFDRVQSKDRVLILGGGTGWILVELLKQRPDCEVWYVDSSMRMIAMAKEKCGIHANVHFIVGTEQQLPVIKFDLVIMNFFLDLFTEDHIVPLLKRVRLVTKPRGLWVVTDFEDEGKWWQKSLLKVMIWFFRWMCNIEARRLPALPIILQRESAKSCETRSFFHGFIKARLLTLSN